MTTDRNDMPVRRRLTPWLLVAAGLTMVAVAFFGLHWLPPVLGWLGMAPHSYDTLLGGLAINLVGGGIAVFVVGLVLAMVRSGARRSTWLMGSGLVLLLAGTGPLVVAIVAVPNSNPILQGVLAAVTFLPAGVLLICGFVARADRRATGA
jgi:hypothetical protein